ncbi:hypothetical protein [Bradyrhizobium sp. BR 1432]|uniref:hypothetical protein n=1 Tax=Bradyrhizobium sp. BR 1432 TaxID=3447966 RepID=UPI003EE65EDC
MKVGKEEIVGALAAVEHWFASHDPAAEERRWRMDLELIAGELERDQGIRTVIVEPIGLARVPRLEVRWDTVRYAVHGHQLRELLLTGTPSVMLDDVRATSKSVIIDPCNLQSGEAQLVAQRMKEELQRASAPNVNGHDPIDGEAPLLAGRWRLHISFLHRSANHELDLEQTGTKLCGVHRAAMTEAPLSGATEGAGICFASAHPYEALQISYRFSGRLGSEGLAGEVALGAATDGHWGPVFCSQFGKAKWRAERILAQT